MLRIRVPSSLLILAAAGLSVTPGFAARTAQGFGPAITQTATPGCATRSAQGFAPTLTISGGSQAIEPGFASRTATGFAPSIAATIAPGFASRTTIAYAPAIAQTATPGIAARVATAFAPSLTQAQAIAPGFAARIAIGYGPTLTAAAAPAAPYGGMLFMDELDDIRRELRDAFQSSYVEFRTKVAGTWSAWSALPAIVSAFGRSREFDEGERRAVAATSINVRPLADSTARIGDQVRYLGGVYSINDMRNATIPAWDCVRADELSRSATAAPIAEGSA